MNYYLSGLSTFSQIELAWKTKQLVDITMSFIFQKEWVFISADIQFQLISDS